MKIQVQELSAERGAVQGVTAGGKADCRGHLVARSTDRKLDLQDFGVPASLHALANGGHRIARPRQSSDDFRNPTKRVGTGGMSAVHVGNCEGMMLANDVLQSPLPIWRQVV